MPRLAQSQRVTSFVATPRWSDATNDLLSYQELFSQPKTYRDEVRQCRFFARYDPLAAPVISRLIDLAARPLFNRSNNCTPTEQAVYDTVLQKISVLLPSLFFDYFVSGLAVPDFALHVVMANRLNPSLGRTRVRVPSDIWLRNTDYVVLQRAFSGSDIYVYYKIPQQDRLFILQRGVFPDGREDKQLYEYIRKQYPEYVSLIEQGVEEIRLNTWPIARLTSTHALQPQPFLTPALYSLKYRLRLRDMDFSIVNRAIDAILHVRAGNDQYPVTEEDETLEQLKQQLQQRPVSGAAVPEYVSMLFTNHTVSFQWVYPPIDALLSRDRYDVVDADILTSMGFSRVLLVGETTKSNAGGAVSSLGTIAGIEQAQQAVIHWIHRLYMLLAEENGFTNIATPVFRPIQTKEYFMFAQYLLSLYERNVVDRDTLLEQTGLEQNALPVDKSPQLQ